MASLIIAVKAPAAAILPSILAVAHINNTSAATDSITIKYVNSDELGPSTASVQYLGSDDASPVEDVETLLALQLRYNGGDAHSNLQQWISKAQELRRSDFRLLQKPLSELDTHLTLRTYITGYGLTFFDLLIYATLRGNRFAAAGVSVRTNVQRWFTYVESSCPWIRQARDELNAQINRFKSNDEQSPSLATVAARASRGPIVTRFPPEPSGYLHIGHAKAALLNAMLAHDQGGTLVCRFDDTNPSKESQEFQDSILDDLAAMDIHPDRMTYSSDYFPQMFAACTSLIKAGKAYADSTPHPVMKDQRKHGIASSHRNNDPNFSLSKFQAMQSGHPSGQAWCIRARISVDDPNKALRDPVIYRCNPTPHHRTGSQCNVYPTYDFCAPFVDAVEGITLALRTTEYNDRNAQYQWLQTALGLQPVPVWEFARLSFVNTVLSKRKLAQIVASGVEGTEKGALREFIRAQGPSRNVVVMDWKGLWAVNRKHIDSVAPRHTTVRRRDVVTAFVEGIAGAEVRDKPEHGKNQELGTKKVVYSDRILLDQDDAQSFVDGEEITLMNWGNAIVKQITRDERTGLVGGLAFQLHLAGDVKITRKKITWLSTAQNLVPVKLHEFGHLITKDKLDKEDDILDYLNRESENIEDAWADCNVAELRRGDIVQFERYGYYRLDEPATGTDAATFFKIPSGKE
ncbi:glutamyl-tRNA synthetase [Myriangium duriaei CBS 260.36]|uniref:glutamate--tRNA ligase n=1 Tax=Myriangium duriaei CBS 260.36 TaxID=1168546 RepID=A0A9P4IZ85_9PEZI|nr:glutamyl-tRNA synthetase [Myriangium duriaei CBS 260.36]